MMTERAATAMANRPSREDQTATLDTGSLGNGRRAMLRSRANPLERRPLPGVEKGLG
jgi:hypothetical protein